MIKKELENALFDMEIMAKVFQFEPFEIYLLGGSGCILAGYIDRATRDFDFIDLDYSAKYGRLFRLLEPFDMIDTMMATIALSYKERAVRLMQFKYLHIYVFSREDIIISKMGRLNERDINDIKAMQPYADKSLLFELIDEVMERHDLLLKTREVFSSNSKTIMKDWG